MNQDAAFVQHAAKNISSLAFRSQQLKAAPDKTVGGGTTKWYQNMDRLFNELESGRITMTPSLARASQIEAALQKVCSSKYFFPEEYKSRAQELLNRFIREGWGAGAGERIPGSNANEQAKKQRKASARGSIPKVVKENLPILNRDVIRVPPRTHPIFGVNGIMHGMAYQTKAGNTNKSVCINPQYKDQARSHKVFGHNGLEVGDWFPRKLVAKFKGAHGSPMAGISGNEVDGAYAIVVSGEYDDLDSDGGNTLFYSGSHSHKNEDPRNPPPKSAATKALDTSEATGKAVRVLRSDGAAKFAPSRGFRYDGLYKVVASRNRTNRRGGLYDQFQLVRLDGQEPLEDYCDSVPNAVQQSNFDSIASTVVGTWDVLDVTSDSDDDIEED